MPDIMAEIGEDRTNQILNTTFEVLGTGFTGLAMTGIAAISKNVEMISSVNPLDFKDVTTVGQFINAAQLFAMGVFMLSEGKHADNGDLNLRRLPHVGATIATILLLPHLASQFGEIVTDLSNGQDVISSLVKLAAIAYPLGSTLVAASSLRDKPTQEPTPSPRVTPNTIRKAEPVINQPLPEGFNYFLIPINDYGTEAEKKRLTYLLNNPKPNQNAIISIYKLSVEIMRRNKIESRYTMSFEKQGRSPKRVKFTQLTEEAAKKIKDNQYDNLH